MGLVAWVRFLVMAELSTQFHCKESAKNFPEIPLPYVAPLPPDPLSELDGIHFHARLVTGAFH